LTQTGYSRFPIAGLDGAFIGYLHIKDVLTLGDDPRTVIDLALVRPLPRVPASLPLADGLTRMRRNNSHLALVTSDEGNARNDWNDQNRESVIAMVAMEDLVEDLVGAMRDATP
jgi:CBS domain containing-hemolysin-like protein